MRFGVASDGKTVCHDKLYCNTYGILLTIQFILSFHKNQKHSASNALKCQHFRRFVKCQTIMPRNPHEYRGFRKNTETQAYHMLTACFSASTRLSLDNRDRRVILFRYTLEDNIICQNVFCTTISISKLESNEYWK